MSGINALIGRSVKYYEGDNVLAAIIVRTWSADMVNLVVFTRDGESFTKASVKYAVEPRNHALQTGPCWHE